MNRAAGKAPDDQAKLKRILDELTKREENKFCADCGCRGPRWASINLGVFICIACSGIHRSLGVHLTFVRSVNLDSWTSEQVVQMQKWGNARAKAYYEANVPHNYRIPNEQSSVREKEMWIRDKYERRRFIAREEPPEESQDRRHGSGSRKKHDEDEEEEDRNRRRTNSSSRSRANESSSSRTNSSSRRPEPAPKPAAPATTNDILSFDVFSAPTPAAPAAPAPAPAQPAAPAAAPAQDEWASFGGSSSNSQGFTDAFAQQPQPAQDKVASNVANIMASFGPAPTPQAPANPFGAPQPGMMPAPTGMNPMGQGMAMNPMGMNPMAMNPMAMNPMGMNPMAMNPMGMNPMMGQPQPNPMMNPMFGGAAPMGMNPMMGGGMFPGVPGPAMGFPQQPMGMGMNPMMGGMNPTGFQQMQPRGPMPQGGMPQQQQQAGGLNQPFVNLQSNGQAGKNPFF